MKPPSPRRPLTSRYPWLYPLRVRQRQAFRWLRWHLGPERFAKTRADRLAFKVYRHQSKLRKHLSDNPRESLWQDNKVHNLQIAVPLVDGVVIEPGETLSLWRLIGRPTARRGFVEGMELSQGRAQGGIGGGLCQLGNLVHWLALHSPLQVTQRSSHSFDPFPDQGRLIPYGTGAALFYNYIDLWLFNPTPMRFQLRLWLTDTLLNGELRCDKWQPLRYRILERNAGFIETPQGWMRHNEIWREAREKGEEARVKEITCLYSNMVRVMYIPEGAHGPK